MPKTLLVVCAPVAAIALMTGTAASRPAAVKAYKLSAALTVAQEVPHPKGAVGGRGAFTGTIALHGTKGTLSWRLTFNQLSGAALAAHIHLAPVGKPGAIIVPLCGPCKSGAHGSFTGPIGGNSQILRAFLAGRTYVNVHTKKNPNGEIRGQIHATATTSSSY